VEIERIRTPADVDAAARALYGAALGAMRGVLHVVAVAREDTSEGPSQGEGLRVIRVGPHAPASATDFFALNLARARVEGIVVSGSVLRDEPELRYALSGPAADALAAWRRGLGLRRPPWLLVLTRGADPGALADHPAWESWARPLVLTGEDAAPGLRRALPSRVEVVGHPAPSPRAALAHLRDARGCRGISVEAGPRVAVPLYDPPRAIDELMLSVFEGPLPAAARGGAFLPEPAIAARLRRASAPTSVEEPSGRWTFSRWLA
jgi:riboflavin biosynthesis pyrimidine reductase